MSNQPPFPAAPPSRTGMSNRTQVLVALGITAGIGVLCLVALFVIPFDSTSSTSGDRAAPPLATKATATVAAVGQGDITQVWRQQITDSYAGQAPAWLDSATRVDYDGSTITVQTTLFPKAENEAAAKRFCSATSGYALEKLPRDKFPAIVVNDQAGNVLVSRRSFGDQCAWRR